MSESKGIFPDVSKTLHFFVLFFKAYEKMNQTEKFVRRFLLRETMTQLSALQVPIEAASDHLDQQAREER